MDDVEKIKSKLDIVDLLGEHLQLKKAGRNFKANCPFHNEKSPSFVISPERQIWHCFGCNKGGDVFTFLQEYENITFSEALRELADRTGVKLTVSAARTDRERKQDLIYSLNHLAQQFYNWLLLSHPAGKRALEYLISERGMTIPLIQTFGLGYAPSNNALTKYLIGKKKYTAEDLNLAGLAFRAGRDTYDFFKNRIIFPIINHRGDTVAFSGRALTAEQGPKYVNTRETPVYVKGDTLFGLNLAKDAIKKENKVIIVEGEFDVITAYKEGIPNIVAVKGTALTENQIKLLKRFTNHFAFSFDADPAGTEAQKRSIAMIEKEGVTATVVIPPDGKDADEVLRQNPLAFKKAIRSATGVYDFIIETALSGEDADSAFGKKNILDKTLPYLSAIENEVIKEHYLKKLATSLDTSLDSLEKQANKIKRPEKDSEKTPAKIQLPQDEVLEIYLLSLIFQSDSPKKMLLLTRGILSDIALSTGALEKLLKYLEGYEQKTPTFEPADFVKNLPTELHVPFDTSFLAPIPKLADKQLYAREVEKTARQVKIRAVKKRLGKLSEMINEAEIAKNNEKLERYEQEFSNLSKLLAKL